MPAQRKERRIHGQWRDGVQTPIRNAGLEANSVRSDPGAQYRWQGKTFRRRDGLPQPLGPCSYGRGQTDRECPIIPKCAF
ncbi:hypothetical protein SBA4_4600009 [Candidatus Sulfopaludibacter sp. SbA4]|nr:hypothetical protein SBA4_4600009 [Candidatus Sulfopaludibacter sp. SbA4]